MKISERARSPNYNLDEKPYERRNKQLVAFYGNPLGHKMATQNAAHSSQQPSLGERVGARVEERSHAVAKQKGTTCDADLPL
jgi:hypothetical protein